jgi:uncharacterized membrane protein
MPLGPVQILVVGFENPQFHGHVLEELRRLKENDTIALVDLLVVRKDEHGNVERLHTTDLTDAELEEFGATIGALIGLGFGGDEESMTAGAVLGAEAAGNMGGDDGSWYVDDAIPPNTAAAIALIEHRWAIPLRDKIQDAGGFHLADAWVHPSDLIAIGMLAAEEAHAGKAQALDA